MARGKAEPAEKTQPSMAPRETEPEPAENEVETERTEATPRIDTEMPDNFYNLVVKLGNCGIILVLFETLSGFALFSYDGLKLFRPKAMEDIWADFVKGYLAESVVWLKEFKCFENTSSAIHPVTGVDNDLATMIRKYIVPGQ